MSCGLRWTLCAVAFAGCLGDADREIQSDVAVVTTLEGKPVEDAQARLARAGARAIPALETALHTAATPGRLNCVVALRRIGSEQAIPLLRHLAMHDTDEPVRKEAEWTLRGWVSGTGPRAEAARAAVRAIEQSHSDSQGG